MAITLTTLMLLAATMWGETEVLHSEEADLMVFEVAWNRRLDPRFPNDLHQVLLEGFNGWRRVDLDNIPTRYIGLAARCLCGEHRWYHPGLYLLSEQDLRGIGGVTHPPLKRIRRGNFAVYLYEEWPGTPQWR